MNKIFATVIKEWLLMRRDIGGLLLLLLMPAIMIIVMAMVQDAPFKDYQELRFDLLVADNDHGALSRQIVAGLKQGKNFHVIDSFNNRPLTSSDLEGLLKKGTYKIGVVIPNGVTAEEVNQANILVNNLAKTIGLDAIQSTREIRKNIFVQLYFDPAVKPAFKTSISFALDKYITSASSGLLMDRLASLGGNKSDTIAQEQFKAIFKGLTVIEVPLNNNGKPMLTINSVQHNVPAWAIFGMFFIVVPIAGHTIREREEGSALRIALIPNGYGFVVLGKIVFHTLVCVVQFLLMLSIGKWLLPVFGLSSLSIGNHFISLLVVALCIGIAATAYGYFIGAVFKTTNQAMPFGAISIVILSAIGGIWVPVEILPPIMKHLALISPLHWSLEAVEEILLRGGQLQDVIANIMVLLLFGLAFLGISIQLNKKAGL